MGTMQAETRQALVGWVRHFGLTMAVYIATIAASRWVATSESASPLRTALILTPILPGLALLGLTVRSYRLCDEFIRLRILQAASLAAMVVAAFSLIYFFLELLGLPRLSTAWFSNIVWAVFVAGMLRLIATGR
jgi:hypothetical protein